LIADGTNPNAAPNAVTVYDLFDDALTAGTYSNANISAALTYGTATGNRTVSTSATITTGTITNLTSSTANITLGTIPTLTAGTTTSTAATITSGTITNLASTTGTIVTLNSTTGTIATLNSTTGTIGNLSTTLAGDFTISQGTGTLGTTGATLGTYGGATSVPVLAINAKGQVTSTGTAAITSGLTGFRNIVMNGDMRIDQRNDGASYAITSSLYGSCDRWGSLAGANGVWSQQRVTTGSTDFPFAMRIKRTAGSTSTAVVYVGQVIETANCQHLAGQTITVSYYATAGANFSATSSQIGVNVDTGTGSDQGWASLNSGTWTGFSSNSSNQVITTTRTRYSIAVAIPAGTNEIAIRFNAAGTGTAGANDHFEITGVQIEAGSTATDFERRPIGTELALCQRYFDSLVTPAANGVGINGSTASRIGARTSVRMRSSPSVTISGTISINDGSGTFAITSANIAGQYSSVNSFQLDINGLSTAQYRPFIVLVGTGTGAIVLNSEL